MVIFYPDLHEASIRQRHLEALRDSQYRRTVLCEPLPDDFPRNCDSCGAPKYVSALQGIKRCEYCGN